MGVTIGQAIRGKTYPANLLPATVSPDSVAWIRLGDDEQYNVILHRNPRRVEVVECKWNEKEQVWEDQSVDPETVDLAVYLP